MKSASPIIYFDLISFVLKSGIRPHLMHGTYLAIVQRCGLCSEDPEPDPNPLVNKQPTLSESTQTEANFQLMKRRAPFCIILLIAVHNRSNLKYVHSD